MIEPIQIIAVLFALFAWSRALFRFKDHKINHNEFIFWSIVWFGVILIAILPKLIGYFSNYLGINRPVDSVIYASIIILFYIIFRIYVHIDNINRQLTKLTREIAIKEKKK